MDWTDDKLKALSAAERASLRANAAKSKALGAAALVLQIDALGLPLSMGALSLDDPLYVEMEGLIWSKEFKDAAMAAASEGKPAMAGVDPLLQRAMGDRYHADNQGTNNAGFIVAAMMRSAGYHQDGRGNLPEGCIAKTAIMWVPNKPLPKT